MNGLVKMDHVDECAGEKEIMQMNMLVKTDQPDQQHRDRCISWEDLPIADNDTLDSLHEVDKQITGTKWPY